MARCPLVTVLAGLHTTIHSIFVTYVVFSVCLLNMTLDAPQWPAEEKMITTPYWPYGYRLNTTCGWFIRAPENHIIVLNYCFYVRLDDSNKAAYGRSKDSLRIYNVEGSEQTPIIRRSRRLWDVSVSRLVYILFESDNRLNHQSGPVYGVCLNYTATTAGKARELQAQCP